MLKKLAIAAAAACLSMALAPAPTNAQAPTQPQAPAQPQTPPQGGGAGVRAGYLNCQVARGVGFVFGMTRNLTCTYAHGQSAPETYTGDIQQYGVNLGFVNRGVIVWAVIAPSGDIAPGSLAGNYGGVAAGAALGYGLGANALFGGSSNQSD